MGENVVLYRLQPHVIVYPVDTVDSKDCFSTSIVLTRLTDNSMAYHRTAEIC